MAEKIASNQISILKNELINHLGDLHSNDYVWSLDYSKNGGRGVFATRDIEESEIIFFDKPLLLGPRADKKEVPNCIVCHEKVNTSEICPKGCTLPICEGKIECQQSKEHEKECELLRSWKPKHTDSVSFNIFRALTSIRGLLLPERKKKLLKMLQSNPCTQTETEINRAIADLNSFPMLDKDILPFLYFTSGVLNTNAFETRLVSEFEDETSLRGSGRGLYPLSCMMNHNCIPNVRYSFDKEYIMKVQATKKILKGEEIFTSYIQIFWGTNSRRIHLAATKDFMCSCARCADPTECGTYLSAIRCVKEECTGRMLPLKPLSISSPWSCDLCQAKLEYKKISRILDVLSAIILTRMRKANLSDILHFLRNTVKDVLPGSNQFTIELKLFVVWNLGNRENTDHPIEDYLEKEKYCLELMSLLEQMGAGECTLKALLYFELYKCREQLAKLQTTTDEAKQKNRLLLNRSWDMLKGSVGCPPGLKMIMKTFLNGYVQ